MKKIKPIWFYSLLFFLLALILFSSWKFKTSYDDYAVNDKEDLNLKKVALLKKEIKIGVIYLTDPAEGAGYTYTQDLGIKDMQYNLGLQNEQIVIKKNIPDNDAIATEKAIKECVNAGCKIIFATSYGYMNSMEKMAKIYPDVYFAHATGYKSNGRNFVNYFGRIYQPRYLSGLVAGIKSKSNKIGYVAAMGSENSEVTGGIDAFAIGVAEVNPRAKIYVKITNSWFDPEKEKKSAIELLDLGCDVLTQHCDTEYPLSLAEERGVWGVGYNSNMSKFAPNATLVSVIWNWGAYYTSAVQSILDGTWDGTNYFGGMQEGIVGITELSEFNNSEVSKKVDEMTARILKGNFNVFDGELLTNTGKIIGQKGSTLDDKTIKGGINWYYKNVIILK